MAPSSLSISEARRIIFNQEDISLPIKRSAWRLFRHEIEFPKTKRISIKKTLDFIVKWMRIQKAKEARAMFTPNPIQKKLLYLLIVEGFTQAQAALELNRSRESVKVYCIKIRKQLGVDSFNQVVAIAVSEGWVPPPSVGR